MLFSMGSRELGTAAGAKIVSRTSFHRDIAHVCMLHVERDMHLVKKEEEGSSLMVAVYEHAGQPGTLCLCCCGTHGVAK